MLLSTVAVCQEYVTLEKDTVFYHFDRDIEYCTNNIALIKSVNGKTQIAMPVWKVFHSDTQTSIIHGDVVQYKTVFTDTVHSVIRRPIAKAKYIEFDFNADVSAPVILTNKQDKSLNRPTLARIRRVDRLIRLNRWKSVKKRRRWIEHIRTKGYIWTKAKTDTIVLYKGGNPWVYIPPIWKKWIIPKNKAKVKLALRKLKPYYISGQVRLRKEL